MRGRPDLRKGVQLLQVGHQEVRTEMQLGFVQDDPPARSALPTLERRASLKLDQLLLSDEGAWVAMLNSASPQHAVEIAGPLVRIFAAEGRDTELVKYCIMMEVAAVGASHAL